MTDLLQLALSNLLSPIVLFFALWAAAAFAKSDEAVLTDVFGNTLIIVIAAEDVAQRIIERSQPLLENFAGIVVVSDVEVIRNEHF